MPGRKDKKSRSKEGAVGGGRKGGGGGGLASMMGFGVDPGGMDDADLEAELLALQGKSPGKKGKSAKGMMSLEDVDKMMAGLDDIGEGDDDDDSNDDDDLLGELQALEEMEDDVTNEDMATTPDRSPPPAAPPKSGSGTKVSPSKSMGDEGGDVKAVSERLSLYQQGLQQAEATGESSKARRYKRSLDSLEKMLKSVKAGRPVNLDDMPPPVFVKETQASSIKETTPTQNKHPPPQVKSSPKPLPNLINLDDPEFDEFNLHPEKLASLATSIKDDRSQSQSHSSAAVPQTRSGTSIGIPSSHRPPVTSRANEMETSPSVQAKPVPKPHPKPHTPKMTQGGLIDLDDPEFDEFNLTEDDIAAMAAAMVDDRNTKKLKLEAPVPSYPSPPPVSRSPVAASRSPSSSKSPQNPSPLARPPLTALPPPAAVIPSKSLPATLTEPVSGGSDKSMLRAMLTERREQYLTVAKEVKEPSKIREYKLIAAKFTRVIKAVDAGDQLDLSQMPGPPPGYGSQFHMDLTQFSVSTPSSSLSQEKPTQTPPDPGQSSTDGDGEVSASVQEPDVPPNPEIPVPKTALEALEQRLEKYKAGKKLAEEEGESSKGRRMGRIVKQYEAAIRDTRMGKPFDFDELPTPPGYPPIPVSRSGPVRPSVPLPTQSLPASHGKIAPVAGGTASPSISQSQITFVERRMAELKTAARQEQAKGDKEKALHYVKMMKGLENMVKAAHSGLPINLEQVPPSPFADLSKTTPSTDVMSHLRPAEEKDAATFELIIKQLEKQVDICQKNAATYKKIGSNASAIEYNNMAQNCEKELLALKGIQTRGYGPPKFSLELRKLTMVHSNTHLSSGVCEVEIAHIINFMCPPKYEEKDMNVYVEVEFPYPTESPPKKSTECVNKMCSPEFKDQPLVFDIDRKHHRSMLRAFKRTPLKCTLWHHRSLKKDIYLGQVGVQLETLENKSEVHNMLELLDERGRKPVGGKMEVFVRLREPITGRDVEECEEQWLVFKESIAAKSVTPMPKPTTSPQKQGGATASGTTPNYALISPVKVENTTSVAALKFEFSLVTSAVKGGHKDGHTLQRGRLIKTRMDAIQQKLQTDTKFRQAYPMQVAKEMQAEKQLEAQLVKQGKAKQAEVVILQKRRVAIEKELVEMKRK